MPSARLLALLRLARLEAMEFLAGIIVAWSVVYAIIAMAMLLAYRSSGGNRQYLVFGAVCLFLFGHAVARGIHYLAPDHGAAVLPGRLLMAFLPLAATALLHLGIGRVRGAAPLVRRVQWGTALIAGMLSVVSLAGLALDYHRPILKSYGFLLGEFHLHEFRLSLLGYLVSGYSLLAAATACVLLMLTAREDRLVRRFFAFGLVVLLGLTANDLLLEANLIHSIYAVEHGFFLMVLIVVVGFQREFERSRVELRDRSRALERANFRLERLAADLSESTQRLESATEETLRLRPMADLGRLSASLAHEIRNPLAVLSNVAATLRRQSASTRDGEQLESLVRMLQEETDRLARLVDDLLLFSQTGRICHEPVDPAQVVESAVAEVQDVRMGDGSCAIELRVEPELAPVSGSAESLRRALVNLILNAVQSSDGAGRVEVIAKRATANGHVDIGVADSAGGIAEPLEKEIFEPFFSTRPTGTGLGLPIVKSIVEAHGGNLELCNRQGEGATFWMHLPVFD